MIKYLVISDIHLGHNKNKSDVIVNHLYSYFKEYSSIIKKCNVLFIAGDIFDKLLMTNSDSYKISIAWLLSIAQLCMKYDIKLRVLEGTSSHDRGQGKILNTLLEDGYDKLDYLYVDSCSIEHMSDLGINVLYVPDEWNSKGSDTYDDVKVLLTKHGLREVDIAIMHGQFHHQLPMVTLESSHNEQDYLDIVKYYIHIGHIHKYSVNGKIVAQGSFDRLAHGEEEDKGAVIGSINLVTQEAEFRFMVNRYATIYRTYNLVTKSDADILDILRKRLKDEPVGSYIRVLCNEHSSWLSNKAEIKRVNPNYHISLEVSRSGSVVKSVISMETPVIESYSITPSNIRELLIEELTDTDITVEDRDVYIEELTSILL